LHFPNLLEDSAILQLLKANNLARVHLEVTGHSMYFPCADIDQAMANCSASFKKNLRRQGRKLSQQGTVTLHLERQGAGLDAAFDDFLRLEASG
jgi:hypothetical protein